jgi:hypothetical protein
LQQRFNAVLVAMRKCPPAATSETVYGQELMAASGPGCPVEKRRAIVRSPSFEPFRDLSLCDRYQRSNQRRPPADPDLPSPATPCHPPPLLISRQGALAT